MKKSSSKRAVSQKQKHSLQFLFLPEKAGGPDIHFIREFAGRIKTEHASRASVLLISENKDDPAEEDRLIRRIEPVGTDKELPEDLFSGDYGVILAPGGWESQINPNEFFRLSLPEDPHQRCYYEILFKGKKDQQPGGMILPAEVLRYLLVLYPDGLFPGQASMNHLMKKLGFEKREAVVNQEPLSPEPAGSGTLISERIRMNLAWPTSMALKESRSPSLRNLFFIKENPLFRLAFLITAVAIFVILPLLSLGAGLSGDDEKHYEQAIKVYNYFKDGDPSALNDSRYKLNYYGQSFDFFTYLAIRWLHLEDNPYEARHFMVAITGAIAILFTALLVKLFAGYSGGWLALILMFLSPRFLGHSFNNPMDIPFAMGNIFTLYHMILFLRKLPRISYRSAIWIAIGIGWTNGIRIGGLLLIPYLFMFSGLYLLLHKWPWKFFSAGWWKFAMKGLVTLVMISVAGYLLSLLTWPYALQDIINHPIQSFKVMTNIQVSIRVLYNGALHWSDHLPWHYIPVNILISVPVLILLGWLASLYTWFATRDEGSGFWYFMLWFTILFPIVFIIYRESNVYGGWRHMIFVYPSMLALSAMAISKIISRARRPWARWSLRAVVLLGLIHPLRHIIHNHPDTYIYFNEWSGGIGHTYGRFETDYYANSLGPATDYFLKKILPGLDTPDGSPITVTSNANIGYYFRNHRDQVVPHYSRYYDRGKDDWDYAILYCNYIHPYQLNHGLWPPKNTIHEIKVDKVVVAAIVERENRDDYLGSTLLEEGLTEQDPDKLTRALDLLQRAVAYDENNESALLELGNAYSAFLRLDEARATMDELLAIYPDYDKAYNLKGYTYLLEADVTEDPSLMDEAIRVINMAITSNYKFYSGYYNLGLCYMMKGDANNAIYNFREAIRYNSRFEVAYQKLADAYDSIGDTEMAGVVREQMQRIQ